MDIVELKILKSLANSKLRDKQFKEWLEWEAQYKAIKELDDFFSTHDFNSEDLGFTEDIEKIQAAIAEEADPDTDPKPGEIRALKAEVDDNGKPELSLFIVLSQWDNGYDAYLVAPFSPYSIPATPYEYATGLDFKDYAVVQVWNAQVVPAYVLRKASTYMFTDVPEKIRREICILYFNLLEGEQTPRRIKSKVGPRLDHLRDKSSCVDHRIEYMKSSRPLAALSCLSVVYMDIIDDHDTDEEGIDAFESQWNEIIKTIKEVKK